MPLPTETDFDPYCGNLDCQHAFLVFGGLNVEQASDKFHERPEIYQEDFMFMGPKAFKYYFSVLEKYLYTIRADDKYTDCSADIIGKGIAAQFGWKDADALNDIKDRILKLALYVRDNASQYSMDGKDQESIRATWTSLIDKFK